MQLTYSHRRSENHESLSGFKVVWSYFGEGIFRSFFIGYEFIHSCNIILFKRKILLGQTYSEISQKSSNPKSEKGVILDSLFFILYFLINKY